MLYVPPLGITSSVFLQPLVQESIVVSNHCIENNHTFSKDKINLLHPGRKVFRLNLLEHLEIRRGLKKVKLLLTIKLFLTVPF